MAEYERFGWKANGFLMYSIVLETVKKGQHE